ncbi:MAG TPA: SLBB domain-containing protein, partial [Bryobacteraceae bacterium]|nr:SLBB domain-containing protein [Bryobacteraceae bacterium]
AVRQPQVFQAVGPVRLLDAISKAGGLTDSAGNQILVTDSSNNAKRIPVKGLLETGDAELNLPLTGGEEIRVLEAGKAFVVGTVKKPGAFQLGDAEQSTVLQLLAVAEGLMPFASKRAFIYRRGSDGAREELAVELDLILRRKHPDVVVMPDDILYIPENRGRRMTISALERLSVFGSAGATALVYSSTR